MTLPPIDIQGLCSRRLRICLENPDPALRPHTIRYHISLLHISYLIQVVVLSNILHGSLVLPILRRGITNLVPRAFNLYHVFLRRSSHLERQ